MWVNVMVKSGDLGAKLFKLLIGINFQTNHA